MKSLNEKNDELKNEILRYFTFWHYYLAFTVASILLALVYLRYADYQYRSFAKIEIIDKAQDSEMALPTAMTIFNRSMINLENEIGVLGSFKLHSQVVNKLKSNLLFFTNGNIKSTQNHKSEWFEDYVLDLNFDVDTIQKSKSFRFTFSNKIFKVYEYDSGNDIVNSYEFESLDTRSKSHKLPFQIKISGDVDEFDKTLHINNFDFTVDEFVERVKLNVVGSESEQLNLSIDHSNPIVGNEYLSTLISQFDYDGINDRQMEYKRTMDFVDSRSVFLAQELEIIENSKQSFKEENRLTDIMKDAEVNVMQSVTYDSELFKSKSQKDLGLMLLDAINKNDYNLMPVNIGLENDNINNLISDYNTLIKNRNKFLLSAGLKNTYVKSLEKEINDISNNVIYSIENYLSSLNKTIKNIENKEKEFELINSSLPEKEKILRKIERELEVKEALFLLLLQKREEAAINYAVIKPSIKIIDLPRNSYSPVKPNKAFILLGSFLFGFISLSSILYLKFFFDDKIHTKKHILDYLDIPILAEIPHSESNIRDNIVSSTSRNIIAEGIRMITANLNFVLESKIKNSIGKVLIVTSSIKGEGKTLISANLASILTGKYEKVCLLGADLRNPQIHKLINQQKSVRGLSDYMYNENVNWRDLIIKNEKLDIVLSGTIPPNPTEMLSSEKFKFLIDELKSNYDYIVIDTAPCVLVSDTFEIAKLSDSCIYVVRSNYTKKTLLDFIKTCHENKKLPRLNLVLNDVGISSEYGYKYGYQYGYNYAYNYGYQYGYKKDED